MTHRTRNRLVGLLAAGALVLLVWGTGAAQAASIPTTLVVDDGDGVAPLTLWGHLTSPNKKCLAGRTVELFADFSDGSSKLVDTDRSSRTGVWAARGNFTNATAGGHVKVLRKRIGRPGHRRTCSGDTEAFEF